MLPLQLTGGRPKRLLCTTTFCTWSSSQNWWGLRRPRFSDRSCTPFGRLQTTRLGASGWPTTRDTDAARGPATADAWLLDLQWPPWFIVAAWTWAVALEWPQPQDTAMTGPGVTYLELLTDVVLQSKAQRAVDRPAGWTWAPAACSSQRGPAHLRCGHSFAQPQGKL